MPIGECICVAVFERNTFLCACWLLYHLSFITEENVTDMQRNTPTFLRRSAEVVTKGGRTGREPAHVDPMCG